MADKKKAEKAGARKTAKHAAAGRKHKARGKHGARRSS